MYWWGENLGLDSHWTLSIKVFPPICLWKQQLSSLILHLFPTRTDFVIIHICLSGFVSMLRSTWYRISYRLRIQRLLQRLLSFPLNKDPKHQLTLSTCVVSLSTSTAINAVYTCFRSHSKHLLLWGFVFGPCLRLLLGRNTNKLTTCSILHKLYNVWFDQMKSL